MLLWYDGYDHYGPAGNEPLMTQGFWSEMTMSISTDHVRTLQNGITAYALKSGPLGTRRRSLGGDFVTVGWGMGLYMVSLPSCSGGLGAGFGAYCIQQFRNVEGWAHIAIMIGTTGRVEIWSSAGFDTTLAGVGPPVRLAMSTLELAAGTYNHIETKVFIDAAGTVEVRVNGISYVSYAGNTVRAQHGSASIAQVCSGLYNGSGTPTFTGSWYYDDDYVWNDNDNDANGHAGAVDDFLGQYGVYYLPPISDYTDKDWSLTSGVNGYALIDEIPPNDDTDYIFTGLVNDISGFGTAALPANTTDVAAVAPLGRLRKTDTGDCSFKMACHSGATRELAPSARALTTSWQYYMDVYEKDSNSTAAPWSPAGLPVVEVKRTA